MQHARALGDRGGLGLRGQAKGAYTPRGGKFCTSALDGQLQDMDRRMARPLMHLGWQKGDSTRRLGQKQQERAEANSGGGTAGERAADRARTGKSQSEAVP